MKPFGLYTEIVPALDRSDTFLTTTTYAAEPEPYRDLLYFPGDQQYVAVLASRVVRLKLASGIIPPLTNVGLEEGRYFLAFTLGRVSSVPTLLPLRGPVSEPFWQRLGAGLRDLHDRGLTYGRLDARTVAQTVNGAPLLFDVMGLRSVDTQPPDVDWAAFRLLRERYR